MRNHTDAVRPGRARSGLAVGLVLWIACFGFAFAQARPDPDNASWAITLHGFFPGSKPGDGRPLELRIVRRAGQWVAGLGGALDTGRAVWNTALLMCDPASLTVSGNQVSGSMVVTLVPDPWIPLDRKARTANVSMKATVALGQAGPKSIPMAGTWSATIAGGEAELRAAKLQGRSEGTLTGFIVPSAVQAPEASFDLMLYDLVPGKTDDPYQRRLEISIGWRDDQVVSARIGSVDIRNHSYDPRRVDLPREFRAHAERVEGRMQFESDSLDGETVRFDIGVSGQRVEDWVVGTWSGTVAGVSCGGYLRGEVGKTAFVYDAAEEARPWFVEVPGHKPVAPGEHPRLFFRKGDLPALRKRAESPEGRVIVRRLRELLNGSDGESLPTSYNPALRAYERNDFKALPCSYSISHGAGFGFLFQLTGDPKYAGLARECVEKAFAGQRNLDDRYAWVAPGGELRAGPSLGWTAVAYDLCYDAWPEDFRRRVALAIQNYADSQGGEWNKPEGITLRKMVLTPRQGPRSNHFGAVVGGCGLAVLSILDDPGTDPALLEMYITRLERNSVRHLANGWGDGGYYNEGWGASRVGTQASFLCFLQALKTARGHDYFNVERSNASYLTLVPRCALVLGPPGHFPYRSNMGGSYGRPEIGLPSERVGFTHGGYFSEGFGAVADRFKPALLWTYNRVFSNDTFDTVSPYPHRAMLALINWPFDTPEQNPGDVLPRVIRDHLYEHILFRNRWQDTNDVVTTVLVNQPGGTKPRDVMVWGLGGLRLGFGEPPRYAKITDFRPEADGSGVLAMEGYALAVDYSGLAGVDALLVSASRPLKAPPPSPRVRFSTHTVGTSNLNLLLLSASGQFPDAKVEGTQLIVGQRTVNYDGKTFTLNPTQRGP
jgi:hypothetical protein